MPRQSGDATQKSNEDKPYHFNYDCIAPDSAEPLSRATVGVSIHSSRGVSFCTGTLINHPESSSRAFVLTAAHCGDRAASEGLDPGAAARIFFQEITDCAVGNENQRLGATGRLASGEPYRSRDGIATLYYDENVPEGGDVMAFEVNGYPSESVSPLMAGYDGQPDADPMPRAIARAVHHGLNQHQQYWEGELRERRQSGLLNDDGSVSRRSEYYDFDGVVGRTFGGASGAGVHPEGDRVIGVHSGVLEDRTISSPLNQAMDNGLASVFGNVRSMDSGEPPPGTPPTVSVSLDPVTVESEEAFAISWSSEGADFCDASGGWSGGLARNGTRDEFLFAPRNTSSTTQTFDYGVICTGERGTQTEDVAQLRVLPDAPSVTLRAGAFQIAHDETTTLNWSSARARDCDASGDWSGVRPSEGETVIGPFGSEGTRRFTLTCTNDGGSASRMVNVHVTPPPAPTASLSAPGQVMVGESFTVTHSSTEADQCVASGAWSGDVGTAGSDQFRFNTPGARSFVLTCNGAGGQAEARRTVTIFEPDPVVVSTDVDRDAVVVGERVILSWSSDHATECEPVEDFANFAPSPIGRNGDIDVGFDTPGTFELGVRCTGEGGSVDTATSIVRVDAPPPPGGNGGGGFGFGVALLGLAGLLRRRFMGAMR